MDFHSCWICVVTELLDVGVAEGPAPAKSPALSPAEAGSSARSLLSVRRDGTGAKTACVVGRSESHRARHSRHESHPLSKLR